MVGEDPVGGLLLRLGIDLDQVGWDIGLLAIDEDRDQVALAIQLGDGVELILVEEPLDQLAVAGLADAPVLAVYDVADGAARARAGRGVVLEQAVLLVIGAVGRAVDADAVAVGVVVPGAGDGAVLADGGQASGAVVDVGIDLGRALQGLGLLGDAPETVAAVADRVKRAAVVRRLLGGEFAEGVVVLGGGEDAEGSAGQQPMADMAGEPQLTGLGQQPVGVVAVGDTLRGVDDMGGDGEVAVPIGLDLAIEYLFPEKRSSLTCNKARPDL
ncbi:hypothetical protein [Thiorhodococcus fuscus]|uniref:hypothetical protein n=1 Tax=Thiorhodococcus fuscus TaxID=527200 RepID=UPI003AA9C5FF